jgi:DNA-directed RNA polymerase specialized sigma24 family protein
MLSRRRRKDHRSEYATCKDFQQIFTQDMAGLHLLAFLLTADQAKAEQCFVAGLDDAIKGNPVFREWARSWSKRAIIKCAIRTLAPAPGDPRAVAAVSDDQASAAGPVSDERETLIAAVTALKPFQRFVFVMAVLEGYSIPECALLLGRSAREVFAARTEAVQQVSLKKAPTNETPVQLPTWQELLIGPAAQQSTAA